MCEIWIRLRSLFRSFALIESIGVAAVLCFARGLDFLNRSGCFARRVDPQVAAGSAPPVHTYGQDEIRRVATQPRVNRNAKRVLERQIPHDCAESLAQKKKTNETVYGVQWCRKQKGKTTRTGCKTKGYVRRQIMEHDQMEIATPECSIHSGHRKQRVGPENKNRFILRFRAKRVRCSVSTT